METLGKAADLHNLGACINKERALVRGRSNLCWLVSLQQPCHALLMIMQAAGETPGR